MDKTINILVVDDKPLVRLGIKYALMTLAPEMEIMAEAADLASAKTILNKRSNFEVVLLDFAMLEDSGLELIKLIHILLPQTRILVYSSMISNDAVRNIMNQGVDGFVSKWVDAKEMVTAIRTVDQGEKYFSDDVAEVLATIQAPVKQKDLGLTDREMEIMVLSAQGLSAREIGKRLFLSHRTIECHKNNIFQKMGFKSTKDLIHYAYQHGLVKP